MQFDQINVTIEKKKVKVRLGYEGIILYYYIV